MKQLYYITFTGRNVALLFTLLEHLVDGLVCDSRYLGQEGHVGVAFARFPFGDGLRGDSKQLSELRLSESHFLTPLPKLTRYE